MNEVEIIIIIIYYIIIINNIPYYYNLKTTTFPNKVKNAIQNSYLDSPYASFALTAYYFTGKILLSA
jgi:hypothetical protein